MLEMSHFFIGEVFKYCFQLTDGDGVPDHLDNDDDGDGVPDHLEEDADGDGIADDQDDDGMQ